MQGRRRERKYKRQQTERCDTARLKAPEKRKSETDGDRQTDRQTGEEKDGRWEMGSGVTWRKEG